MNPVLRPAVPSDYATIATWIPDADACARWAGPQLRFPFAPDQLHALLAVGGESSYCMTEGTRSPLGFGQFWPRGENAVHLGRIVVSPHERGKGYGITLCDLLLRQAWASTAAERATLRVYRDNIAALAIYSRLGFVAVESESNDQVFFMQARRRA
ncbi:GNAT family N-acetyltransferase [Xanthomonas oryzae]|uniref:GNAT family N-acetyltransferase n=1 Tax=Xanthomonas oryzae TaxID=347 RepID=UPI0006AC643D|nr:GNAT family protein [Xanthomonas oryzae]QBG91873.1 GNAT family N-acetyltransferase [Xanthomonas oryzae]QBG95736.1 GNAT family N-acetyltransferase [Xanthomonas oryzae]QBG99680.1 GNAT family N-acetyltransferase [Xanthomonas oryzae]